MRLDHTLRPLLVALGVVASGCSSSPLDDTGASDTADDTGVTDSGVTDSGVTDSGVPADLNGDAPAEAVALPTFSARNLDGEERTEADLLGHPTVMWFYPAAGTYG